MFKGAMEESMLKLAKKKGLVEITVRDLRDWTHDRHRTADDKPFGGGPGMVMKVEPVDEALAEIKGEIKKNARSRVILMTPQGQKFEQKLARSLAEYDHLVFLCGHYEGVDERIRGMVDNEISIGDYVLTGGELPAMVVCDAVIRLIPGVLGRMSSLHEESFENGMLEYPQYTRPAEYKGMKVPEVLLCGDPKKIEKWKKQKAVERTRDRRPDLLENKKNKES